MVEDEFDNFMERVTKVEHMMKMLKSSDPQVADRARQMADILVRSDQVPDKHQYGLLEEGSDELQSNLSSRVDRTVINKKAFEVVGGTNNPTDMTKEDFMAQVEKDAQKRAKDRKERKQRSDELKAKANKAFREKKFEEALDLYSKAIDETRDSALLFENRALTYLHLELFQRVVKDCESALGLNANSLKALLYKAKALYKLKEEAKSEKMISEALKKHPQHHKLIQDYKKMWNE